MVKPVEQNESVCAEPIETLRHVGEIAKVRAELHRQRDPGGRSYAPNSINISFFDCTTGNLELGRYPVDVKFQRIGSDLSDLTRVANPTSESRAVETRDDWNFQTAFGLRDMLEVRCRRHPKFRLSRNVRFRLFFEQ